MKHRITTNTEWGSKARKREDAQRGLNNTDRKASIAEALEDIEEN